jgi:FKBP-type peptidyl-prolyl cis-trans isomerase 2
MTIKKGDFIEIDYTAYLLEENAVFDTTNPEQAEKSGMICEHDHEHEHGHSHVTKEDFKPIIICVGEKHVLPGLDEQLIGLNLGEHDIILGEENAFGKKDSKLLKLMPLNAFKKQKINPFPGLTVDMDGTRGVVRSVSGGRVIVDFNHPLSGKAVKYSLKIIRSVDSLKEKAESIMNMFRIPFEKVSEENKKLEITLKMELPPQMVSELEKEIIRVTKAEVKIKQEQSSNKELNKEENKQENKQENKEELEKSKE